jgi:hypothetical protein
MTAQSTENEDSSSSADAGQEVKKYSDVELKALVDEQTKGLKSKVDELLGEKKSVTQKAREAEEKATQDAEKRAKESNDFKSLFESSEAKREESDRKYNDLQSGIRKEKRTNAAMKLAGELASGSNAELLSEFVSRRLDINEEGKLMVLDGEGNPTVSTLADLKKDFISSGKFDSLIDGSKSTGSGATTTKASGAGNGSDLSKMTREQKLKYFADKRQ